MHIQINAIVVVLVCAGTYHCRVLREPHEHAAFSSILPQEGAVVLARHKVHENVLACRVERPVAFSPAHVDFVCASFAKCVLPVEEHEAGAVFINRPTLLLNQASTLHNVDQLYLLVAGKLGECDPGELGVDQLSNVFSEHLLVVFNCNIANKERRILVPLSGLLLDLLQRC